MAADKNAYFKNVAKGLAASTTLYKVDSVVHVEDKDDIWFWEQLLPKYRAGRYKFKPATMNEKGKILILHCFCNNIRLLCTSLFC